MGYDSHSFLKQVNCIKKVAKFALVMFVLFGGMLYLNTTPFEPGMRENQVSFGSSIRVDNDLYISVSDGERKFTVSRTGSTINRNIERIDNIGGIHQDAALIETETKSSSDGYTYVHNETKYVNSLIANESTFTPQTISPFDTYENLVVDVNTTSLKSEKSFDVHNSKVDGLGNSGYSAQGIWVPQLNITNTKVLIDSFRIDSVLAPDAGIDITGSIWSAKKRADGFIIPDQSLATENATTTTDGSSSLLYLNFNQNVTISQGNTWTNDTGGFFFVVISKFDSDNLVVNIGKNDTVNSTVTYYNNTGVSSDADWGSPKSYDYDIVYNTTVVFQPDQIGSFIETSSGLASEALGPNGIFTNSTDVNLGEETTYLLYYTSRIPEDLPVYFDTEIFTTVTEYSLANVDLTDNPTVDNVNWTISYTNPYTLKNIQERYFLIPNTFTVTSVEDDGVELLASDYTVSVGSINKTVTLDTDVSNGEHVVNAQSSNLFDGLLVNSYVNSSSVFEINDTAVMGIVGSPNVEGDSIKANVSIGLLDIATGRLNATFRSENGSLLTDPLEFGDHDNITDFSSTVSTISFITPLDVDLDTGVWSVQFRWFNGTAAGSIWTEFVVIPDTDIQNISPTSNFNALEGDIVTFEVGVIDNSHTFERWQSDGQEKNGSLEWDFDPSQPLNYSRDDTDTSGFHIYSTDLDLGANPVTGTTDYLLNSSFTDGIYTIFVEIIMTTYLRGDTDYRLPPQVEYGDDIDFDITPLDLTNGNVSFDSSSSIIDLSYRNSQNKLDNTSLNYPKSYDISTSSFNFTIPWQDTFVRTTQSEFNEFTVKWNVSDYREIENDAFVTTKFNITILDTTVPSIKGPSDLTMTEEETEAVGVDFQWNITDEFDGNYSLYINRTDNPVPVQTGDWTFSTNVTYDMGSDGLDLVKAPETYYIFEIVYEDADENKDSYSFTLTVIDVVNPAKVNFPLNVSYSISNFSDTLSWTFTDNHPDKYVLEINEGFTEIDGSWTSGDPINIDISDISNGDFNYTIIVNDTSNNIRVSTALISVDRNAPSVITELTNLDGSYELGSTNNWINWTGIDSNQMNFTVYENDRVISSADNSSEFQDSLFVSLNIDGRDLGEHNFTLVVEDTFGNRFIDTVLVEIVDTTRPSVSGSEDTRIFTNQTDYQLIWQVTDLNPNSFQILRNGTLQESGDWTNQTSISYTVGSLDVGLYNFTLVVDDNSGNLNWDSVIITVKPQGIIETNDIHLDGFTDDVYEGDVDVITGEWTELLSAQAIPDATINLSLIVISASGFDPNEIAANFSFPLITDENGEFELTINYTSIPSGSYYWDIIISKDGYEPSSTTQQIDVLPHTISITLDFPSTLVQGEPFEIVATVLYTTFDNASGLTLSEISERRSGAVSGITVNFVIDYISDGATAQFGKSDNTNDNGRAIIILSADETRSIDQLVGITGQVQNPFLTTTVSDPIPEQNLPPVQEAEVIDDLISTFTEFIQDFWQFVVGGLFLIILVIAIINRRIKSRGKRRAEINVQLENASDEISALLSIQAVILKNSESGIPFYYHTFEEDDDSIDLSLISSLTTAISTFLSELQEGAKGFETMERQGISLTSHRLDYSDLIVISKQTLPVMVFEQIANAHQAIEERFKDDITNPLMIQEIEPDDINREMVANSFKIDLKGFNIIDISNIKRIKDDSSISRTIRSNLILLEEFANITKEAMLPINLPAIIDYLSSEGLTKEIASRLILVAYQYDIIRGESE